jgi:hypothetical protein
MVQVIVTHQMSTAWTHSQRFPEESTSEETEARVMDVGEISSEE